MMMIRRTLIGAGGLWVVSRAVRAQPARKVFRIGILSSSSTTADVDEGGLICNSADLNHTWWCAAAVVDKILNGAKPANLPLEQPTKFNLVINRKAAQAIGLVIQQSLLLRADEVIQ